MADAHGSGPCESNFMEVQVLLSAPRRGEPLGLPRFVYTKHGCACQAAAPFSQKTFGFSGALFFIFQSSLCFDFLFAKKFFACSLTPPLSQKVFRLFGSRLRRFFILEPLGLPRFLCREHGCACHKAFFQVFF